MQLVCQSARCALVIVHHWNKTGEGKGAKRMSGAGPGEWGRVLVSVAVRRRVWSDDPADLSSKLHYDLEPVGAATQAMTSAPPSTGS